MNYLEIIREMLSFTNLLMMNVGVFAGIVIGALPGLNAVFAVTVLLPLTFGMSSTAGMFLLLGAYCGASFGGSISAILINTPGTAQAAATVFDGYPLAKQGRSGDALKTALYGSTIGGMVSAAALLFLAPQIAKVIQHIGSPEYFALCIFGMSAAVGIAGKQVIKGVIMCATGLLLSTVGLDTFVGTPRFLFGSNRLMAGLAAAVVMLGTFALAEVLVQTRVVHESTYKTVEPIQYQKATIKLRDMLKYWKTILKSCIFGIIIGATPGTGGAISAMFSYNEARRSAKHPEEFGTGVIEGVLAPETGNNATTGATMIPMLTFGIPGDACMAVLMGALTMQGISPGASLFTSGNPWVYIIMGGLFLVNLFMLIQGAVLIRPFANVTRVPQVILLPIIAVLCSVGAFAIANSSTDVFIMVIFGLIGFFCKIFNFPIAPMTIGMVLGYLAESNLRRSLILSGGSMSIFVTRPASLVILLISLASLLYPYIREFTEKRNGKKTQV